MNPNWKPVLKRCMSTASSLKRSLSVKDCQGSRSYHSFLSMLANYYDKDRKGELKLDE